LQPVVGEGSRIDIIFLVERLESLVANGKKLPLTNNVVVDQAGALDLIDQIRVAVPEEVRQAKRINQESDRILDKAQEEADRIVARAQEHAAFLIEERELTRAAEIRSQEIVADGRRQAEEIRRGADAYAASVLVKLEGECVKALQSIKRGIAMLDERRPVMAEGLRAAEPLEIDEDDRRAVVESSSHAQL
jgi:cell division septum initiation protein DivIVA